MSAWGVGEKNMKKWEAVIIAQEFDRAPRNRMEAVRRGFSKVNLAGWRSQLEGEGEGENGGKSRVLSLDMPTMIRMPLTQESRKGSSSEKAQVQFG